MDVATALPKVPTQNLHIPRADYGRVWAAAEQRAIERGPGDYYLAGVVITLRWIARQAHRTPVTRTVRSAMPETLDTEYMAALAASRSTKLHPMRVDMARGAVAVLGWVGHGTGEPSLTQPLADAG